MGAQQQQRKPAVTRRFMVQFSLTLAVIILAVGLLFAARAYPHWRGYERVALGTRAQAAAMALGNPDRRYTSPPFHGWAGEPWRYSRGHVERAVSLDVWYPGTIYGDGVAVGYDADGVAVFAGYGVCE